MIYFVIIFLIFGIWQAFMKGSKSEMIGGISFWLAIIILAAGLVIGKIKIDIRTLAILGLIIFFILNYIARHFKFYENLKIREIIYEYRDFKEKNPEFNEDQLCRLTLKNYYQKHDPIGDSDKETNRYINDLFKNELNLKYTCEWIVEKEYPKYSMSNNSHDLNGWREKNKNLKSRIEYFLNKIPNL